jgi:hypothetical protein
MRKGRTLAASLGVLFLLTLTVSPAKADSFCAADMKLNLNDIEGHHQFNLPEQSRAGTTLLFSEVFENNNGKHLGFSIAQSINRGNKFGLFKSPQGPPSSAGGGAIPNPEPAAVFLLGTGLAAAGAFARKRFRKSNH